jgi:hypothetical protein
LILRISETVHSDPKFNNGENFFRKRVIEIVELEHKKNQAADGSVERKQFGE